MAQALDAECHLRQPLRRILIGDGALAPLTDNDFQCRDRAVGALQAGPEGDRAAPVWAVNRRLLKRVARRRRDLIISEDDLTS